MRKLGLLLTLPCLALSLSACIVTINDDGEDEDSAESDSDSGSEDHGTDSDTGMGDGDADSTDGSSDSDTSTGDGDSDTSGGDGDTTGGDGDTTGGDGDTTGGDGDTTGGDGDTTGGDTEIHDCTLSTAIDMTGMDSVTITNVSDWGIGHSACVRVSAGTTVVWTGSVFSAHPLVGGIAPDVDGSSPIPTTSTGSEVQVVLSDAGVVPYFCQIHPTSMQGVIYVE